MLALGIRLVRSIGSAGAVCVCAGLAEGQYLRTDLVSNNGVPGTHADANLTNAWGVAFNPTGFVWVSANHSGTSTLYDGNGVPQSLVVSIPAPGGATGGAATGIVYSGSPTSFSVTPGATAPARFIWATEDGTIAAWNPGVPQPPPSTQAQLLVDNSASGAIYKGLAIDSASAGSRLFATDFHNNKIDVFDSAFAPLATSGSFTDPTLPAGFAPFNIKTVGTSVFVTYALQDQDAEDDVPGAGNGFIDEFDFDGGFVRRFASGGVLDSPWGMAVAPANFGAFSGALLVGNFGDGHINAFDRVTGAPLGALEDSASNPIAIDGLWGFDFGNGVFGQPTNTLFFAAGPDGETNGLYGRIDLPTPGVLGVLGAACGLAVRRRSRA